MKINVGKIMTNRALLSPDLEAFAGDGYRYTFARANARVNQFAAYLAKQGIAPGDRAAILCKNSQQFATAFFAAAKTGAVTVPLNWRLQAAELGYILNDSGATFLLYDPEFSSAVEKLKNETGVRCCVQAAGPGPDPDFESVLSGMPAEERETTSGGDDPAIIMYTSGTTGKPKGAVLTHNNLFWSSVGISHTVEWQFKDRFLSVAPLFHIGGLAPIVTNVHKGCTTYFMPDFNPLNVWKTIAREKINNMMTVPLMLAAMLKTGGAENVEPASLRSIICGGSAVPENLIKAFHQRGISVYQVYGITEYTGAVTFWTTDMGLDKCNSMGKPVFHGSVKIAHPDTGRELPPGEVGEILCSGPQVFKGYWNNPEATGQVLVDGWYRSGDLGKKDADGFIYVVDRLKDMIISGGENIYSAELEAVIGAHPGVAETAVIGVPDPKWGEVPMAFVVKKPGAELSEEDIFEICKKNLASYKCVKKVRFIDALPRNAVGKILKAALKEMAASDN